MTITKWNPAKELLNIDREFRKMFDTFNNRFGIKKEVDEEYESAVWMPMTDIAETDNEYLLKLDLPGIDKKDVKLTISNGELQISGDRKEEKITEKATFHRVERTFGKYYRSFRLPEKIKAEEIKAEFVNGTLSITIPKAEEVKPKEIEIKVNWQNIKKAFENTKASFYPITK